ncbi:MAG: thioesterase family protein [Sandaracinaceae bacterium]
MFELDVSLPRTAFSPREVARAPDVWRAFQEVAVAGSTLAGWPPARLREAGVAFIVRSMTVRHQREAVFGEALRARTWAASIRRGMFFRRESRLAAPDGPVAGTTQRWVHVGADLSLTRATEELARDFPEEDLEPEVTMPAFDETSAGPVHAYGFRCWHTWMDPLAHVNHPAYLDWFDEGTARVVARHGIDPVAVVPVAETLTFREGITAPQDVRVESHLAGRTDDGAVAVAHRVVRVADGRVAARGTAIRRLRGGSDALADAFRS